MHDIIYDTPIVASLRVLACLTANQTASVRTYVMMWHPRVIHDFLNNKKVHKLL
jgi:hypothetical protein